jgi:hypothetical protein
MMQDGTAAGDFNIVGMCAYGQNVEFHNVVFLIKSVQIYYLHMLQTFLVRISLD